MYNIYMAKLHIYADRGISLSSGNKIVSSGSGGKRGKCNGTVSSASFRRLRQFCITHTAQGNMYGVTCTIPGLSNLTHDTVRSLWHDISRRCAKAKLPIIWRVELQRRGMPHFHLLLFGDDTMLLQFLYIWYDILSHYTCYSIEYISANDTELVMISRAHIRGANYSVDVQYLSGDFQSYRYLINHSTKAKQAQLGFVGRQWGVISRTIFRPVQPTTTEIPLNVYYWVLRRLRRLTRRHINPIALSFWVCNPATVQRLVDYALSNYATQ